MIIMQLKEMKFFKKKKKNYFEKKKRVKFCFHFWNK